MTRVLITGGAGFIGSHVADDLLGHGFDVRVLDSLVAQVHGADRQRPEYLDDRVELFVGDVRDRASVDAALDGIDAIIHLAAAVGVGQSMYEIDTYVGANSLGTAVLLQAMIEGSTRPLVVASSMSIYGEGLYARPDGSACTDASRTIAQLERRQWDPRGPENQPLAPLPTPESKPPMLSSVYALSKYDQERLPLIVGHSYGFPVTALRLFNVYGPRQALSNPYTGVLAIFASRLLNDEPPLIFEDGGQMRDFVHVRDVARAFRKALTTPSAAGQVLNIGSGQPRTILQIAVHMARCLGKEISPAVTGAYRAGDIRHCFADVGRARALLALPPPTDFDSGLIDLCRWLEGQKAIDRTAQAQAELSSRGLAL